MIHGWQHLQPQDRETILRGIADGNVYGGPYHLELDWVDKCNARCFFCNSEELQLGKSLAWERATSILEEARDHGLRSVRLSGGGEPTLHPHLPELLEFMAKNDIILDHLNTNGTMLTDRVIDALGKVKVTDVRISLNYCDPETYAEGMRLKPHFFHRVCENMRKLDAARRGNPHFGKLTTQFFVYKPTLRQIPQMYALGRELGADLITFRELYEIDPQLQFTPDDVPQIMESMREVISLDWREGRVESLLQSHGLKAAVEREYDTLLGELGGAKPHPAPAQIDMGNRFCYIGWYSMTIMGNQSVFPCCFLMPAKWLPPLENLENKTLQEAWRGPAYADFRRQMREFMLLRQPRAFFHRPGNKLDPGCHSHHACPMTPVLADDAFYAEAEARLAEARRSLEVQKRRVVNSLATVAERGANQVKARMQQLKHPA